jgi:hypothetical protein
MTRAIAVLLASCLLLGGCVREVLSGEDPDVLRPTATGDTKRDQLVFNVPWMEAPIPRMLIDNKPIVADRVSTLTPEGKTSYLLRTRTGASATILITANYVSPEVAEFTYDVQRLPQGYALDLPVGLSKMGHRGAIKIAVNGAPFITPPTSDIVIVDLARDAKTRITCTRVPEPAKPGVSGGASPAPQPNGA